MIDSAVVDVMSVTVLRIVVWANVGFATVLLLGTALWLACAWREIVRPTGRSRTA